MLLMQLQVFSRKNAICGKIAPKYAPKKKR